MKPFDLIVTLLLIGQSPSMKGNKMENESPRVIGGYMADLREFPFMVSIQMFHDDWSHHCGGTIISANVVLTACHCLVSSYIPKPVYRHPQYYRVVAGVGDLRLSNDGQIIKARRLEVHPQCGGPTIYDDAGVIELQHNFHWNSKVKPVSFFSTNKEKARNQLHTMSKEGVQCYSPGWGTTSSEGYSQSWELKVTPASLMGSKNCSNFFCKAQGNDCDTDFYEIHQVCANSPVGIACNGDSGGPLICNNQLYGIVSWKWECTIGWPHVYADIAPILDVAHKYLHK